jgi:hypothetical protein
MFLMYAFLIGKYVVIICISDDKAGKPKEELGCRVRVTYQTQEGVPAKRIIEEVENENQKCLQVRGKPQRT